MEDWHGATRGLGIPLGGGTSFDLDFHTIPYYGKDALVEKPYISKRSRSQMGILSLVARDAQARHFVYVDAEIRKKKRNEQILSFVDFWRERTGAVPQELVFESTFTTYANLAGLQAWGTAFLTLRRRSRKMLQELAATAKHQWRQIRLTGRTFRTPRVLEENVRLRGYKGDPRQIAIKDLGHDKPTMLLTNQWTSPAAQLVERYARRMVIENTLADAIDFFHMDALSSAVPMNIDVDLQLTLIESTLYRLLATRIGNGLESAKPRTLFRKLVRAGADVTIASSSCCLAEPITHICTPPGTPTLQCPFHGWETCHYTSDVHDNLCPKCRIFSPQYDAWECRLVGGHSRINLPTPRQNSTLEVYSTLEACTMQDLNSPGGAHS